MVQGDPRSTMIHDHPISLRGKSQGSRDISRVKGNLKGKGKSQGSREISRVEGNLKGKGKHGEKSRGRRGWISRHLPCFGGVLIQSSSFFPGLHGLKIETGAAELLEMFADTATCWRGCTGRLS